MNLSKNGFIVQRYKEGRYQGIEGDNWYFNYMNVDNCFASYHDDNIDRTWKDSQYVDCCADIAYIKEYVQVSRNLGIDYRILLCETERAFPQINEKELSLKLNFIGYDYAYSGGSYYSCVLSDIISGRISEFQHIKLNEKGLFDEYEQIKEFIECREKMMIEDKGYILERGDFLIYKLYEVYKMNGQQFTTNI